MAKKATSRKDVKAKIIPATKFVGTRYVCVRCDKTFSAKKTSKYCGDKCRVLGPRMGKNKSGQQKQHGPIGLAQELEEYFDIEDKNEITPAGLLLFLGIDRKMWTKYESKPQLARLCQMAQLKLEHYGTKRLYDKGRVADVFFLKNMGWKDKQDVATKETIVIGDNINDEQAKSILERFVHRSRVNPPKSKGKGGGDGTDSEASKK